MKNKFISDETVIIEDDWMRVEVEDEDELTEEFIEGWWNIILMQFFTMDAEERKQKWDSKCKNKNLGYVWIH